MPAAIFPQMPSPPQVCSSGRGSSSVFLAPLSWHYHPLATPLLASPPQTSSAAPSPPPPPLGSSHQWGQVCSLSSGAQGVGGCSSVCWDATPGESHSGLPPVGCRSLAGGERGVGLLSILALPPPLFPEIRYQWADMCPSWAQVTTERPRSPCLSSKRLNIHPAANTEVPAPRSAPQASPVQGPP